MVTTPLSCVWPALEDGRDGQKTSDLLVMRSGELSLDFQPCSFVTPWLRKLSRPGHFRATG